MKKDDGSGLTEAIVDVLHRIADLDWLRHYVMVGDTALSLQLSPFSSLMPKSDVTSDNIQQFLEGHIAEILEMRIFGLCNVSL